MAFWKACSDKSQSESWVLEEFHEVGSFEESFVVLVPKKSGEDYVKDFRAINFGWGFVQTFGKDFGK